MAENANRESMDTLPTTPDAAFFQGAGEGGEGNIEADRRYRAGVEKTVKSGNVEELANEAAEALDGPEGAELREAEERAKEGVHKPS